MGAHTYYSNFQVNPEQWTAPFSFAELLLLVLLVLLLKFYLAVTVRDGGFEAIFHQFVDPSPGVVFTKLEICCQKYPNSGLKQFEPERVFQLSYS